MSQTRHLWKCPRGHVVAGYGDGNKRKPFAFTGQTVAMCKKCEKFVVITKVDLKSAKPKEKNGCLS